MGTAKRNLTGVVMILAVSCSLYGCGGGGGDDGGVAANRPPVAAAGPDQTVDAGSVVTLAGSSSDPDGSIAGVQWRQTAGTTTTLSGSDQLMATFAAPEGNVVATLVFRLTVTDDDGATSSDAVTVTVRPAALQEGPFVLDMSRLDDPLSRLQ